MIRTFLLTLSVIMANCVVSVVLNANDRVIGVVGDASITRSELEEMKLLLPTPISDEEMLNHLIEQKLLLIQADRDSIIVKDEELSRAVESSILDLKGRFPSDDAYKAELKNAGMTETSLRDKYRVKIKEQMSIQKLFQKKFGKELAVSDVEAIEFYKANKDSIPAQPAGVRLLGVALKYEMSEEAQRNLTKKAETVLNKAKKGESFTGLVKKHSEDTKTKENDGDLGTLNQNDMGMEFREVVAKLSPGDVGLVESQGAYHIIKCEAREGETVKLRDIVILVQPTKSDSAGLEKRKNFVKNILDTISAGTQQDLLSEGQGIPKELKELKGAEILSWGEAFVPLPNTPFTSIGDIKLNQVYAFNVPFGIQVVKPLETQAERMPQWENIRDELKNLIYQRKINKFYKQLVDKLKQEIYTKSLL